MERLIGKIATVTGGASGIGEATVRRFVAEGAKVVFADRDGDRGKRVAAEIEASGGKAIFVEAHMEREAEAAAFVRQAADRFGRLDVLVNNAGIRLYHTVVEASAESWDEILGVNLKGYAFCAKAADDISIHPAHTPAAIAHRLLDMFEHPLVRKQRTAGHTRSPAVRQRTPGCALWLLLDTTRRRLRETTTQPPQRPDVIRRVTYDDRTAHRRRRR